MSRKRAFSLLTSLWFSAALVVACEPNPGDTETGTTDTAATDSDGSATASTEGDSDTGAGDCPGFDPPLQAAIDVLEVGSLSQKSADCAVQSASNIAGKITLDLLCSNDVDHDVSVVIVLSVPDDFKVDFTGVEDVRLDYYTEAWEPPGAWFALHDLATDALVLAADENYGVSDAAFAPLSFAPIDSCGDTCQRFSTYSFAHADGPEIELSHQSRGTLSAAGRAYDIALASARSDLCDQHGGSFRWILGSAPQ